MTNVMDRPADLTTRRAFIADTSPSVDHHYDEVTQFQRGFGLFPAAALDAPMFEGKDFAGLVGAIVITLGPLAAYSLGWGA